MNVKQHYINLGTAIEQQIWNAFDDRVRYLVFYPQWKVVTFVLEEWIDRQESTYDPT